MKHLRGDEMEYLFHQWPHLYSAFEAVERENERLEAAMKKIANGDGYYGAQAAEYKAIARAALHPPT